MRKARDGGRLIPLETNVGRAVLEGRSVDRLCSAEAGTARRPCWVRLTYSARNPLVVSVAMCAPSQAVVFERLVPRAELRQSVDRRVSFPDLVMYPDALRGRTMFRFSEDQVMLNVAVQATDVALFLREADGLVPVSDELDAVNAALAFALGDERVTDLKR